MSYFSETRSHGSARFDRIALYFIPYSVTAIVFIPIIFLLLTALTDGPLQAPGTSFTFSKVLQAYTDPQLLTALWNSIEMGIIVAVFSTAIAIPMAFLLVRTDTPGRRLFLRLVTLAFYMSPLFLAIAWAALGAPRSGLLNQLAKASGLATGEVANIYSYSGIIFVGVLHFIPVSFLLISSALTAAAGELDDASYMSRAGLWRTFRSVTLPLITPTIVSSLLQVGVFAAEQFAVPFFLGIRFNFQTLPTQIYLDLSLSNPDYNRAAAGGTMLLWFSAIGIYLFRRYMKLGDRYAAMAGKSARVPRPVELKKWRWPAAFFVGLYLFLSVIAPILALAWGSLHRFPTPNLTFDDLSLYNWLNMFQKPQVLLATKNTLIIAGVGAFAAVLVSLVLSFFIVRTKARGRAFVDYVISFPVAIPSIVLGLGVLAFYFAIPLPLYGTLFGLGLAVTIRFLGYGVRALNAGLQQVHSELTEAAYMSRASGGQVIRQIQFPLLRPTIANTWVVLFVKFSQEVNLSVLIYTQATMTLPILIFNQLSNSLLNAVYPITLLLVTITFICIEIVRLIPGYDSEVGHVSKRLGAKDGAGAGDVIARTGVAVV